MERIEYVLRLQGLADPDVATACHRALRLVAEEMVTAETDIPWGVRERWPLEVVEAAGRLCDRFVHEGDRDDQYMQTGVRSVADRHVREDFIAFAPHAYDATFWRSGGGEVASLSDEAMSFVIWLTEQQRTALAEAIGSGRVISLTDWTQAHPATWRKWLNRLGTRNR